MDKYQIISFIEGQIALGKISKEDVAKIAGVGIIANNKQDSISEKNNLSVEISKEQSSKKLINVFYIIGAIIVLIGIIILLAQNWNEIGFFGRILVTLGIALATYISALIMNKPEQRVISQVLFIISAALAPFGSFILLYEAKINFTVDTQIFTSIILLLIYGVALLVSRRNILSIIVAGFATWTYYAFIIKIFGTTYFDVEYIKWLTMLLGISYLLIAYAYKNIKSKSIGSDLTEKSAIQGFFYGAGTLAILGAGISIGGVFDIVFIAFIFAAFYGSIYLRSSPMLFLGAIFLVAHIIKLTSEYFTNSVSWPLMLIIAGFVVIGIGYMTFYLNKKFISAK